MVLQQQPCPCGTTEDYALCCGPLLAGEQTASTAEALMRSRYTAFVVGNETYLAARPVRMTLHPPSALSGADSASAIPKPAGQMMQLASWNLSPISVLRMGNGISCMSAQNSHVKTDAGCMFPVTFCNRSALQ